MKKLLCILASALTLAFTVHAQEPDTSEPMSSTFGLSASDEAFVQEMRQRMDSIRQHRPTVALVLSGGGAKGAATIGALQYLKKYDFPIDIVAGTSVYNIVSASLGIDVCIISVATVKLIAASATNKNIIARRSIYSFICIGSNINIIC